jgi:hypothetical protein
MRRSFTLLALAALTLCQASAAPPKKDQPPEQIAAFLKERDRQATAARLKGPKRDAFLPELSRAPEPGQIGLLTDPNITATEIIDAKNMLVDATYYSEQVIARGNALASKPTASHKTYWLRDFDTSKYADGAKVTLDGLVEVAGTESFDTEAGGRATVMVLKPYDRAQLDPYLPKAKGKTKKPTIKKR